jgi:hypothetical protein
MEIKNFDGEWLVLVGADIVAGPYKTWQQASAAYPRATVVYPIAAMFRDFKIRVPE